jgi:energy-coupling factor transporter ATP-binding protein EcfA2
MGFLADIKTFGDVSAEEDDSVLSYFLKTDAVDEIESGSKLVVIGRKGSGKTALAKYFDHTAKDYVTTSVSLRTYPWNMHAERRNLGASEIESYVSSWRYLLAVKATSLILAAKGMRAQTDAQRAAHQFLLDNYGGINPSLSDILRPKSLKLSKTSFSPSIMGNALGGVEFDAKSGSVVPELDSLTDVILENAQIICGQTGVKKLLLHIDELDQGLSTMDEKRSQMIIGLILAGRTIRALSADAARIYPIIYVRSDIWDELRFSDKNKISQSSAVYLEWNADSLREMVNERIRVKLGNGIIWEDIEDGLLMRGSQTKWGHIISRTFLRPRDVIQFLNYALIKAVREVPDADGFDNTDIQAAREPYSRYLKQELDDEIGPHWDKWSEALQACSDVATITLSRDDFEAAYAKKKSARNKVSASEALELLYQFSVIGYRKGIGSGGSGWVFQYTDPDAGWDSGGTRLKVHPGLKEFAKLREERAA